MKQARSYDKRVQGTGGKTIQDERNKECGSELGIPVNTLNGWVHKAKLGKLDLGFGE